VRRRRRQAYRNPSVFSIHAGTSAKHISKDGKMTARRLNWVLEEGEHVPL
jgi:hypothetical protein